jgi:hypothetical protein
LDRISSHVEALVLSVHQRNGGRHGKLEWHWRLLEPSLGIDSLDLAEIVVSIEKEYGRSLFDNAPAPRTWADVLAILQQER